MLLWRQTLTSPSAIDKFIFKALALSMEVLVQDVKQPPATTHKANTLIMEVLVKA